MLRREFVIGTTLGAVQLSMGRFPPIMKEVAMGVVVHSYANRWRSDVDSKKFPSFRDAIDLLEHCHEIGAAGVQVGVGEWTLPFSKKVRDRREKLDMYLEGSIAIPANEGDLDRFDFEISAAREAGATIVRTVCLPTRRYETFNTLNDFANFRDKSLASLRLAEPVVRKHQVRLAVENHKDWRAAELVDLIARVESEWVGVTLDFGNNIALLEDPMKVVSTLAPYSFSTHVKDMGVAPYEDGFLLSEVPLGEGIVDLPAAFRLCRQHNPQIAFNLEMITRDPLEIPCLKDGYWATFDGLPARELAAMLRRVRDQEPGMKLPGVSRLTIDERLATEEKNVVDSLRYVSKL